MPKLEPGLPRLNQTPPQTPPLPPQKQTPPLNPSPCQQMHVPCWMSSSCAMKTLNKTLRISSSCHQNHIPCCSSSLTHCPIEDTQRCSDQVSCICGMFSSCGHE